jgi:hypothetical protein
MIGFLLFSELDKVVPAIPLALSFEWKFSRFEV